MPGIPLPNFQPSRFTSGSGVSISFDSALSVADDAAVSTVIATASVSGQDGPHTFTLTDDASGQFAITTGGELSVAAALTVGAQSIGISATNGVDDPVVSTRSVSVTVIAANSVAPVVSGTPEIGETLATTNGTWSGFPAPVFTYQWQRGGVNIAGATSSTYTLADADDGTNVDCDVTATNSSGAVTQASNALAITYATPVFTTAATISAQNVVGQTLTATPGVVNPPSGSGSTITYAWTRDASPISGATASTYTLVTADENTDVTCVVTATTNNPGTPTATSTPTAVTILYVAPAKNGTIANKTDLVVGTADTQDVSSSITGNGLTWSLDTAPAGITINSGTGVISYPDTLTEQTASAMTVRATNNGGFETQSFTITVGIAVASSIFKRDISNGYLASRVRDDYNSEFVNQFNSGFCIYTKLVIPPLDQNNAPIFSCRMNGGLLLSVRDTGLLNLSNWATLQLGTTAFTAGQIVSVFIRHTGGVTTMTTQVEGAPSPVEEFSASRTYTATVGTYVFWGGATDSTFNSADTFLDSELYDSAVWLTDAVSASDGLDLLDGTKSIADVAAPNCWFEAETGNDKSESIALMKNWDTVPTGEIFSGADVPGDNPDNFVVLRDPSNMQPVQYDAGSGLRYWAVYDNRDISGGTNSFRLATSADLATWTDNSEVIAAASGQAVSDFLYMGGETGSHEDFFIYYSTGGGTEAVINLTTSDDMSTWTADASNPIFSNPGGPGDGIEDFRVVRIASDYWMGVYEHDRHESDGARSVGAALHTGTVPSGSSWTNQTDDILGTSDVGYEIADHFMANPVICKDGSDIWLFYEGAVFTGGNEPVTLVRKITPSANSDVFTPSNWQKFGIANWRDGEKAFANCASVESGTIHLYLQQGSGAISSASDGIGKISFDTSIAVSV